MQERQAFIQACEGFAEKLETDGQKSFDLDNSFHLGFNTETAKKSLALVFPAIGIVVTAAFFRAAALSPPMPAMMISSGFYALGNVFGGVNIKNSIEALGSKEAEYKEFKSKVFRDEEAIMAQNKHGSFRGNVPQALNNYTFSSKAAAFLIQAGVFGTALFREVSLSSSSSPAMNNGNVTSVPESMAIPDNSTSIPDSQKENADWALGLFAFTTFGLMMSHAAYLWENRNLGKKTRSVEAKIDLLKKFSDVYDTVKIDEDLLLKGFTDFIVELTDSDTNLLESNTFKSFDRFKVECQKKLAERLNKSDKENEDLKVENKKLKKENRALKRENESLRANQSDDKSKADSDSKSSSTESSQEELRSASSKASSSSKRRTRKKTKTKKRNTTKQLLQK